MTDGYDPVQQAISQLAREGAPTRPLMTGGLVAFGLLLPLWARVLGRRLRSRPVEVAATVAGLATLAVAALPLTRQAGGTQDLWHAVAAGVGYVAMALTPLLAAGPLRRAGLRRAAPPRWSSAWSAPRPWSARCSPGSSPARCSGSGSGRWTAGTSCSASGYSGPAAGRDTIAAP
jgi:hypothetical protein